MKILVVTNLYPPQHIGGYELGCQDVVRKLRERGHNVQVLTSSFRNGQIENPPGEIDVERILQFNHRPTDPPHDKRVECRKLAQVAEKFSPEIIYFWNQAGLCLWLPVAARWQGRKCAFFLSDTNFISWRVGAWLAGLAKKNAFIHAVFGRTFLVRGAAVIQGQPCHFASQFLRDLAEKNGILVNPKKSAVAHWGIELSQFTAPPRERYPVCRLLYVGQLIAQKGVHTAIAALGLLAREPEFAGLSLTIAGGGMHPEYEKQLQELAAAPGLAGRVKFAGKIPRSELPRIYAEHDVLVFPSEWEEPFAITPLEAITAGLVVVGTTTGGSGELFRDRETAMTFRAGDAGDCARAIRELAADQVLFENISQRARAVVRGKNTLEAMIDVIEQNLQKIGRAA